MQGIDQNKVWRHCQDIQTPHNLVEGQQLASRARRQFVSTARKENATYIPGMIWCLCAFASRGPLHFRYVLRASAMLMLTTPFLSNSIRKLSSSSTNENRTETSKKRSLDKLPALRTSGYVQSGDLRPFRVALAKKGDGEAGREEG